MKPKTKTSPKHEPLLSRTELLRRKLLSWHAMGKVSTMSTLFEIAGVLDEHKQLYLQQLGTYAEFKPNKDLITKFIELLSSVESTEVAYKPEIESPNGLTPKIFSTLGGPLDTCLTIPSDRDTVEACELVTDLPDDLKQVTPQVVERKQLEQDIKEERRLASSEKQTCTLFKFQERAALEILDNIKVRGLRNQLLQAGAGIGKTFILGAVIRRLLDENFIAGKTFSPWPICYITKAPVVTQTERVLEKYFGVDIRLLEVMVINVEQLRAKFGQMFIEEKTTITNGDPHIEWKWRPNINPLIFILDECQIVKNEDSTQAKIVTAISQIPTDVYCIYSSATPFTRVCEARSFMLNCRMTVDGHYKLNASTWTQFAKEVAAPADPTEHSPSAIDRLMKRHLLPYMVDVKGVKPQFRALNRTTIIDFDNDTQKKDYDRAWAEYEEECARAGKKLTEFAQLALFTILRRKAEVIRCPYFARRAYQLVEQEGKAVCIGVSFKKTIVRAVTLLVKEYGVPRDKISIIWGGAGKTNYKKKVEQIDEDTLAALKAAGIDYDAMIRAAEENDAKELEEQSDLLQLGVQSKKERDREILKFQSGQSLYCFFTFKAGGVGLSLHHTDEFTKAKCRRKKDSGYAVEEDIPSIPTRSRYSLHAPTYSAIEMVQALGRAPRLTSLSDTFQELVFYRGTIEEEVAAKVSMKLKCLKKVVRQREHWEDIILNRVYGEKVKDLPQQLLEETVGTEQDDSSNMFELDSDIEEEDEDSEDNN